MERDYQDNMMTYLKWRGDLTVKQCPVNEVDALILAEMSYVDLEEIVADHTSDTKITIAKAAEQFAHSHTKKELEEDPSFIAGANFVFLAMAKTKRFKDMELFHYVNQVDYELVEQFAAVEIQVDRDLVVVAFRGTDDNMVGWKENFNMSYQMPVPAQESAVQYMNQVVKGWFTKYWVVGHSKGGNLAIYASSFCLPAIQKKIKRIYSFDGPGFPTRMNNEAGYRKVAERIFCYVPQFSVVGMLLEHHEECLVVKSDGDGLMQHDPLSWTIVRDSFEIVEERDKNSYLADETISTWLSKIDSDKKEQFIEALFSFLEEAKIHYLSDLLTMNLKKMLALLKAMTSISSENRELITKLLYQLWEESNRIRKKQNKEE